MQWRRRAFAAVAGVCAAAGLVVGTGTAQAAPATPKAVTSATLGHICDGQFANIAKFVIISDGGIPAGKTWTVGASNVDWAAFIAPTDSPLIQTTRVNQSTVSLKTLAAIPSGTVIKVSPSYFAVDWTGTVVTISGYGGSDSMYFTMDGGPC
jgi:hypothetical protein